MERDTLLWSSFAKKRSEKMIWNIFDGLRHISQVANSMRRLMLTEIKRLKRGRLQSKRMMDIDNRIKVMNC
ncbi:hypothetical protein K1719_003949 [Acacia pycnantha]|nr:hypothetical protein K1719_003949 [Acacia pycnantha]